MLQKNLNPIPTPINKKCQHCDFEAHSDEGILKHTSKEIENNFGRLYFCKKCNFKSCTIEDLQQHLCIKISIDAYHDNNPNTVESVNTSITTSMISSSKFFQTDANKNSRFNQDDKKSSNQLKIDEKQDGKTQVNEKRVQNLEGHKDHKCEHCDKSYSGPKRLRRHIYIVHEGHKDYKCESCGKSFTELRG